MTGYPSYDMKIGPGPTLWAWIKVAVHPLTPPKKMKLENIKRTLLKKK